MKRIAITISFVWLALLATLSGVTFWNLSEQKAQSQTEKVDFRKRIHGELLDSCAFHDEMIYLFGGWANILGKRVCNGVVRTYDGMIINTHLPYVDTMNRARRLKALCDHLGASGKKMLYVQVPCKIDRDGELLPKGFAQDYSHKTIDDFLLTLDSLQIPVLDLRGILDSTPEDVKRYFFKTDHHWNFDGAFKVFPTIAHALVNAAGAQDVDITPFVSPDAWKRKRLPRKFLGSDGRRTGVLFVGTDKFFYYVPRFKTSISKACPTKKISRSGAFKNSIIEATLAKKPKSMLLDAGYSMYGSDYDYIRYVNDSAPVKKRLLVSKDSFALPIVAWLTTVFERIDVVDLRFFKQMTLEEAANVFGSDVVAVMYNPAVAGMDAFWQFGGDSAVQTIVVQHPARDIVIPMSNHAYNHVVFEDSLAAGGLYKVSAKSVEILKGSANNVTMALLNKTTGEAVKRVTMPLSTVEWVLDVPNDDNEYAILLYAGEAGKCAGVGLIWRGMELYRIK